MLDIAVIRLPHIANFTDFDPLGIEPGVHLRFVQHPAALGMPDLVIVPGSKATVLDLVWMRASGFAHALSQGSSPILGICAGYQMMGEWIQDSVESRSGLVDGLALLPVTTTFEPGKITRQSKASSFNRVVHGYQIHHGRVSCIDALSNNGWVYFDDGSAEVFTEANGRWIGGTTLHGLFESNDFRWAFLRHIAALRNKQFSTTGASFAAMREAQIDRVADVLERHVDVDAICALIASAGVEFSAVSS